MIGFNLFNRKITSNKLQAKKIDPEIERKDQREKKNVNYIDSKLLHQAIKLYENIHIASNPHAQTTKIKISITLQKEKETET